MLELLYTDRDIAVLVKPVGLISEDGCAGESVIPAAAEALAAVGERETALYPVHRLDRNVGGVMVYARNREAAAALSVAVRDGRVKKVYLALVHGMPDAPRGVYRDFLYKDARKNKTYVVTGMRRGVREAELSYETLVAANGYALVRVLLHTGRSHQIRVQFASRKMPLLGDGKYGARDRETALGLFSHSLTFPHPSTGVEMTFSALPHSAVFAALCDKAGMEEGTFLQNSCVHHKFVT